MKIKHNSIIYLLLLIVVYVSCTSKYESTYNNQGGLTSEIYLDMTGLDFTFEELGKEYTFDNLKGTAFTAPLASFSKIEGQENIPYFHLLDNIVIHVDFEKESKRFIKISTSYPDKETGDKMKQALKQFINLPVKNSYNNVFKYLLLGDINLDSKTIHIQNFIDQISEIEQKQLESFDKRIDTLNNKLINKKYAKFDLIQRTKDFEKSQKLINTCVNYKFTAPENIKYTNIKNGNIDGNTLTFKYSLKEVVSKKYNHDIIIKY